MLLACTERGKARKWNLVIIRKLIVQPQTKYLYAGPSVLGFSSIVSYFGAFQEAVDLMSQKSEEPDSSPKRGRN
ncbi:hypothetical protein GN956_G12883 [Arapaima gigas]